MEAIYEFKVHDMPVTVAVDAKGRQVHLLGLGSAQPLAEGVSEPAGS